MSSFFNEDSILTIVPRSIYFRGKRYFNQNRVKINHFKDDFVQAEVYGSQTYLVEFEIDKSRVFSKCSCPYFKKGYGICKHIVAALLEVNRYAEENAQIFQSSWKALMHSHDNLTPAKPLRKEKKLIFELQLSLDGWDIVPKAFYIKKNGTLGREMSFSLSDFENGIVDASEKEQMVAHFFKKNTDGYYYYHNHYQPLSTTRCKIRLSFRISERE